MVNQSFGICPVSPPPPQLRSLLYSFDDSEHNTYAQEWTLDHFFVPCAANRPFKLILAHAKPTPSSTVGFASPGAAEVLPFVEADLKKITARVVEKAKELCINKSAICFLLSLGYSNMLFAFQFNVEQH
ncbi:uncharacterized protein LOC121247344 [Juglans microcarpa x Juglans regia]|uniref:uncharacterized protein LOC121247344 n=1 Tax=Juglans microcarpa x Juglans regia TaxID=2249226 RepID=UPI001B7F6621|nr:uncharacterized protein LOC121247344 [Juglans microcarpa x Juglans regia]